MKYSVRLNLLFVLVFLAGLVVSGVVARRLLTDAAEEQTVHSALLMMESALAVRSFTIDEVKPVLAAAASASAQAGFQPITVPAYAATQTFRRFQQKYPDFQYREAVLNPTNPANTADAWERSLIERFRHDPAKTQLVGEHASGRGQAMYVARPIRVSQPACLSCHSVPEAAPAAMVQQYGASGGFGWQTGELIGVQLISVPTAVPLALANRLFLVFVGMYVSIFSVLLAALNIPIRRWMAEQRQRQVQLERAEERLQALNQELLRQSTTDMLTGLKNRREFDRVLLQETARVERTGAPLGLLLLDVDQFKPYNDQFGHVAGDEALARVAGIIAESVRVHDIPVRYGGEEFAVLLPGTDRADALLVAERIRAAVEAAEWRLRRVTVSVGVAVSENAADSHTLIDRADQSLYEAKHQGRNRSVCLA